MHGNSPPPQEKLYIRGRLASVSQSLAPELSTTLALTMTYALEYTRCISLTKTQPPSVCLFVYLSVVKVSSDSYLTIAISPLLTFCWHSPEVSALCFSSCTATIGVPERQVFKKFYFIVFSSLIKGSIYITQNTGCVRLILNGSLARTLFELYQILHKKYKLGFSLN